MRLSDRFPVITLLVLSALLFSVSKADSLKVKYDLFSFYLEKGIYDSALESGSELFRLPEIREYSQWFFPKFSQVIAHSINDSNSGITYDFINAFYSEAVKNDAANLLSYKLYHTFFLDKYFNEDFAIIYPVYQSVLGTKPEVDEVILKRISEKAALADIRDTSTILSVLDILTFLLEKYPDDPKWGEAISNLADSPDELLKLRLKLHDRNPGSAPNNWAIASIMIEKQNYNEALIYLSGLVSEFPEMVKYWKALTLVAEKTNDDGRALEGYLKLLKLEPAVKEYYFNTAVLYERKDNYAAASKYFRRASEVAGGWGKALFYEGLVYENSARACGSLEFYDKCVYQMAYEKYLNAIGYEPALAGVQERINAIEKYLPDPEDFKKNGYKPGDQVKIKGSCYIWIEELLKVQ